MRYTGFIGPSYTLESRAIDAQRCINWYPKVHELGNGKSAERASLIGTPGLKLYATVGLGPIRGTYKASNGFFYVVSGYELFYINASKSILKIGELLSSTGPVDFADNGATLVMVDGENGYWHTFSSGVITRFTGSAWLGSTKVNFVDGFFLFNDPGTSKFYISGLNDITLDALDFATAEGSPDRLISTLVNHREIWLFGEDTIETWYNSGNPDFPFARNNSGFMETGCAAAFSVAKIGQRVLWLGKDKEGTGIVYMAHGPVPQRISTFAVENAIQSYGDISDARAWTYQQNGHSFYVLNFTAADTTWVYDLTTGFWHERAYFSGGQFQRHRADSHTFVYDKHIVGDYENANLYELDISTYSDNGDELRRLRAGPHISQAQKRIAHSMFQLEAEMGTGLSGTGLGIDPKIMLQFSDDGGYTWSNEKWVALGKIGEKKARAIWRRLGMSRDRIYRIIMSDPVKADLIGAEIEVEGMAS